jgi:DNA-binding SARP family transcriptional activator
MEFHILGPLVAEFGGRSLPLGEPQQQLVLAVLLLDPERVVPIDRIIDAVWGERPPATAVKQIRNRAAALRRLFARAGCDTEVIATHPCGYRVSGCRIDTRLFDDLVQRAQLAIAAECPVEARDLLRRALALWRGPFLAGLSGPALRSSAQAWQERQLTVLETCVDLELGLGHHQDLVAELTALAAEHPLHERIQAQLMLALYRCGRQSAALAVYRAARALLDAELGLAPGALLEAMHVRILRSDPALDPPPAQQARVGDGPSHRAAPRGRHGGRPGEPAQRPTDVRSVTGRSPRRRRLDAVVLDHGDPRLAAQATAAVRS